MLSSFSTPVLHAYALLVGSKPGETPEATIERLLGDLYRAREKVLELQRMVLHLPWHLQTNSIAEWTPEGRGSRWRWAFHFLAALIFLFPGNSPKTIDQTGKGSSAGAVLSTEKDSSPRGGLSSIAKHLTLRGKKSTVIFSVIAHGVRVPWSSLSHIQRRLCPPQPPPLAARSAFSRSRRKQQCETASSFRHSETCSLLSLRKVLSVFPLLLGS